MQLATFFGLCLKAEGRSSSGPRSKLLECAFGARSSSEAEGGTFLKRSDLYAQRSSQIKIPKYLSLTPFLVTGNWQPATGNWLLILNWRLILS